MSLTPQELQELAKIPPGSAEAWAQYQGDQTAKQVLAPLIGVTILFLIVNTAFLALRLYTVSLRVKNRRLYWDDWLLIPAYVSTTALCAVILVIYKLEVEGNGPAHRPILDGRITPLLKSTYSGVQFLLPGYTFTRLSILVLFLRLFNGRITRMVCYFMFAFVIAQYISFAIACLLQCIPIPLFWDKLYNNGVGKCLNVNTFYRSFTPPNIASDCVLIITPLPTVWGLNASLARKIGYSVVFFTGTIALCASIVREIELQTHNEQLLFPAASEPIISWLVIEPSLYLVTACLPGMVPLLTAVLPSTCGLRRRRSQHQRSASRTNRRVHGTAGAMGDFMPLVDDQTTTARAERQRKAPNLGDMESVPMENLRQVTEGARVLVTTEITVTQEEKMENVLGF